MVNVIMSQDSSDHLRQSMQQQQQQQQQHSLENALSNCGSPMLSEVGAILSSPSTVGSMSTPTHEMQVAQQQQQQQPVTFKREIMDTELSPF